MYMCIYHTRHTRHTYCTCTHMDNYAHAHRYTWIVY